MLWLHNLGCSCSWPKATYSPKIKLFGGKVNTNRQWILKTHGDPLGTLRSFIQAVWRESSIDRMLVSLEGADEDSLQPRLLSDPDQMSEVNPFRPVMTLNATRLIPEMVRAYPQAKLGAILRPCEMRALVEVTKHAAFLTENLVTICIDCLGTFPAGEFNWRAQRKGSSSGLTQEALQFARQGGIAAYRYRSACQTCIAPGSGAADLNIGVLGLPVRQCLLVYARDRVIEERLNLKANTIGKSNDQISQQRERMLAKLAVRRARARERVALSVTEQLPADVDTVIRQLEKCGACQKCLDACPICAVIYPRRGADGHYARYDVARWLVSCAGCGMCEQACPNRLPLSAIFGHIRDQLGQALMYTPGESPEEPLPLL